MKFRISHPGFGDFGLRVWVWVCFSVRNAAHVEARIENVQLKNVTRNRSSRTGRMDCWNVFGVWKWLCFAFTFYLRFPRKLLIRIDNLINYSHCTGRKLLPFDIFRSVLSHNFRVLLIQESWVHKRRPNLNQDYILLHSIPIAAWRTHLLFLIIILWK